MLSAPHPFRLAFRLALCMAAAAALFAPGLAFASKRCANYSPERRVLWGDLHVHTAISMDAYIFQTRLRPADAYRFATGGEVKLPPLDAQGRGTRPFRIARPLDFAAVTDHAHAFGGTRLCTKPGSAVYDSEV